MKKLMFCLAIILMGIGLISIEFYNLVEENNNKVIEKKEVVVKEIKDTKMVYDGWIHVDSAAVKSKPNKNSKVVGTIPFNESISYTVADNGWYEIKYDDKQAFVHPSNVSEEQVESEIYYAPNTSGFKSFMDYRAITCTGSDQYKLQQIAETNEYGVRVVDGRYCVAVGSHYTSEIGQYFDLVLVNGTVIPCVLGDQKADIHTDSNNVVTEHNGCMSEFVVETDYLPSAVQSRGNMSYYNSDFDSPVMKVVVYDKNAFDE